MKIKHIISGIALVLAAVACTDEAFDVKDPMVTTPQSTYTAQNSAAGSLTFSFQSNMPWSIRVEAVDPEVSVSDVKVSPKSGNGSLRPIDVQVTYGANKGEKRQARISIITVSTGASVTFVQPGANDPLTEKGSLDDPYKAGELVALLLSGKEINDNIYVTGIVSKIGEISTSYGNATFWITDDGTHPDDANQAFYAYRVKGPEMAAIAKEDIIKKGDTVVLYGKVVLYKGTTPETSQNTACIYSVNGVIPE